MSSGSKTKTVTKQETSPWAPAIPYLTDVMSRAGSLISQGQDDTFFPFSTTVPFSNQSEEAMGLIEERARNGSPLIDTANAQIQGMMTGNFSTSPFADYLTGTAQGDNLNGNPWLDTMFDHAADRVTNRINGTAGLRGRAGSGAHQQMLQTGLGKLANGIYAQNYQQERNRQIDAITNLQNAWESDYTRRMNAVGAAESLAMVPYQDAGFLNTVGAQRETQAQSQLTDLQGRHTFEQMHPWQLLTLYSAALQGMGQQGGNINTNQTITEKKSGLSNFTSLLNAVNGFKMPFS